MWPPLYIPLPNSTIKSGGGGWKFLLFYSSFEPGTHILFTVTPTGAVRSVLQGEPDLMPFGGRIQCPGPGLWMVGTGVLTEAF